MAVGLANALLFLPAMLLTLGLVMTLGATKAPKSAPSKAAPAAPAKAAVVAPVSEKAAGAPVTSNSVKTTVAIVEKDASPGSADNSETEAV